VAGLLLFGGAAALRRVRGWPLVTSAAVGFVGGAVLAAQWQYMVLWNRYATEWLATGAYTALALAFAAVAVQAIHHRFTSGQLPAVATPQSHATVAQEAVVPPFSAVLADWRAGRGTRSALQWLGVLRLVFLFGAAAMALLLVFDARYRGFPIPLYALPLMSLLLLLAAGFKASVIDVEEAVLATVVLACAIAFIYMERLSNLQALTFGLQSILLAGTATGFRYWRYRSCGARPGEPGDRAGA
jgi:glucan 1,3-beta-glucosidase